MGVDVATDILAALNLNPVKVSMIQAHASRVERHKSTPLYHVKVTDGSSSSDGSGVRLLDARPPSLQHDLSAQVVMQPQACKIRTAQSMPALSLTAQCKQRCRTP